VVLKLKRIIDPKPTEFPDMISFLYEKGSTEFRFEDINKNTKHIPVEEVDSFEMDILNLVYTSIEDNLKHVHGMKAIRYNKEKDEFRLEYVYGSGNYSHLDIQRRKVYFINGIF